jgi:HSP20 family molecular chaperone IbpA
MNDSNLINSENEASRGEAALLPPVDVIEDADGITLYADLPGVSKLKFQRS